jgi:L,D-transpeptidase catalytic domain
MQLRVFTAALVLLIAGPACAAQVVISINENSQKMTVMVGGQQEYVWPVSTGIARYATPTGRYTPFRMEEFHFSEEWDDAPMPHSIFFTPLGHAIHGTEHVDSLGKRASHGCVRLDPANAATLYALVQQAGMPNTTVVVTGGAGKKINGPAVVTARADKKVNTTGVAEGRADINANTFGAIEERADNRMNKKPQLWPYERMR